MPDPIRVAVLGYGLAGRVFHCPFISAVPGLALTAVMQRHGEEALEAYPQVRLLRSPEAAFADPTIDLVIVATPNGTHESLALAALRAGKHVVVDKPVAASSKAVLALAEAAQGAGKLIIPFHNRRWDGDFLTLQRLLHEGQLGRVVRVVSQWDRFRPTPREGTWKEQAGDAHGMLQDLGPHLLDQALVLFGLPQHIQASVRRDRDGSQIEDAFDLTLLYDAAPGSAQAPVSTGHRLRFECSASMIAAESAPRFRVNGTEGSFVKHGLDPQEAHLVADGRRPPQMGSSVPWIEEQETAWGTLTVAPDPGQPGHLTHTQLPTITGDYRIFYAGVRDAIGGSAPPPVSIMDAFRVARLIELARQSSREQRTLPVDGMVTAAAS